MRPSRAAASTLTFALALIGCQQGAPSGPNQNRLLPEATEKPKFVASPTPTPSGPPGVPSDWPTVVGSRGNVTADFEGTSVSMADWKDPKADDGHTQSWLYSGTWNVVGAVAGRAASGSVFARPSAGGRALEHNDMRPQPALSFRRYAGKAFGTPDGELPNRYTVTLNVTPLDSRDDFFPPVGDQGTPVYYVDPTHYVEVLMKPNKFEVWECNGGEPLKWRGWRPMYEEAASHSAGVTYTLGAEVNANSGTIRVYQNGTFKTEVKSDIVKPYSHYFSLRAGSNRVQFDNIVINGY